MDEYTKAAVARHERAIKQLKKKIATAQALHKSMPGKTVKQRKERDNVKYKMESELQDKASSLKLAPMNWYIMKAYAESGLPKIADVAKEYIENNDEPSDKSKKTTSKKVATPKKKTAKKKTVKKGDPPKFAALEKKARTFASNEKKLEYYFKKKAVEYSKLGNKSAEEQKRRKKEFIQYNGPKSAGWQKKLTKLGVLETKLKKLRKLYVSLYKLGFEEKYLLSLFRIED